MKLRPPFLPRRYVPPNPSNLRSVFAHLTNYSLNKHHRDFVHVGEEELTAIQRRASFDDRLEQLDGGGGGARGRASSMPHCDAPVDPVTLTGRVFTSDFGAELNQSSPKVHRYGRVSGWKTSPANNRYSGAVSP